jgi:hypothetical protein
MIMKYFLSFILLFVLQGVRSQTFERQDTTLVPAFIEDSSYLEREPYIHRDKNRVILIGMAPIVEAGISGTHSITPSSYSASPQFSYEAAVVFVYADRPLIDRFFCVPIFGGGFSSNGVLYRGNGLMDNTIRSSYANAYAGLAFPFLQLGVSAKFPLFASSSLQLEENVEKVVSLSTKHMNTIWEPCAILFYPIPMKSGGAVVPYIRFAYALTETFNSPFSLSDQNFTSSDQRLESYKSFSLKIGFTYAFTIFRHYESKGFDEEEGVY